MQVACAFQNLCSDSGATGARGTRLGPLPKDHCLKEYVEYFLGLGVDQRDTKGSLDFRSGQTQPKYPHRGFDVGLAPAGD